MKKYLLIFVFSIAVSYVSAQDIHFTQYDENPSLVNPALVGSRYVMRASVCYKDQWGSVTVPYRTYGVSYEMKFKASAWEKTDPYRTKTYKKAFSRLAGGLSFYGDKAGDGNMGTNMVNLSLATFIKTSDISTLSVGLQGGVIQKSVNFEKFIFSNQYNGTNGYDPNISNQETEGTRSFLSADFAGGLLWHISHEESAIGENNQLDGDIGAAVFHVNKPKQKFLTSTTDQLYSKIVVHSRWTIGIPHSNIGIAPSIMAQFQGPQKELIGGLMIKYYLKTDSKYTGYIRRSSVGLGVSYRGADALAVNVLLEMGQYAVGLSYDINTSGLKKVSTMRGGPEITFRFNSANRFLFQKR